MSKWTKEEVLREAAGLGSHGYVTGPAMLREYAAHLAAQAEWPSDEDVRKALSEWYEWNGEDHSDDAQHVVAMRAALQSVRPPVGVVSDEMRELYAAASKGFHTSESSGADSYYTHKSKFHTLKDLQDFSAAWTKAMLASRHAPNKD